MDRLDYIQKISKANTGVKKAIDDLMVGKSRKAVVKALYALHLEIATSTFEYEETPDFIFDFDDE